MTNIITTIWTSTMVEQIYEKLEKPNWAPRLSASFESLQGRTKVFPEGQLVLVDMTTNKLLASLSTNRINRDGNPNTLPCWDTIAGDPTDYGQTYISDGNAVVLMSMNIHPDHKGLGLPKILLSAVKSLAKTLGAEHCIGSFRPNQFGSAKAANPDLLFEEYIVAKNEQGFPLDGWIRNVTRNGMQPIKIDDAAMTVLVPLAEFEVYKATYFPELWKELSDGTILCKETGQWTIEGEHAFYREKNLRGSLSLD